MIWVKAFIAGFLATLLFHQGAAALLWLGGLVSAAPWNMTAMPPLGIPKVISLAFWGGVWGVPVWWLIRRWGGGAQWFAALLVGAVGPTALAMLLVFPLKGIAVSSNIILIGLIVNGLWGVGVSFFMRYLK